MKNTEFILQKGDCLTREKSCAHMASGLNVYVVDHPILIDKEIVPIGTVEFCLEYIKLCGAEEPKSISYPSELKDFLYRNVRVDFFGNCEDGDFVKPVGNKTFTGDIKKDLKVYIKDDCPVWRSDYIEIIPEYRFYILRGEILGYSRYDDSEVYTLAEDTKNAMFEMARMAINKFTRSPVAYTIDIGIGKYDELYLIECNDAWAIGYYPWGTMSPEKYIEFISARWSEIINVDKVTGAEV